MLSIMETRPFWLVTEFGLHYQTRMLTVTKLLDELPETVEILNDTDMMKNIRQGMEDIKDRRFKKLSMLPREEAC